MWNSYAPLAPTTKKILGVLAVVSVLAIWSIVSGLGIVGPAKLPTPWAVAEAFASLAWDSTRGASPLWEATVYSTSRVLVASLLVVVVGVPLGVLMGSSPKLNAFLSPLIDPFRSAPVVAILPILVMWLGIDEQMKIAFLFIGSVVYLVPMVRDAVVAVPSMYWTSARDLGASPWECVRLVLLPLSMPRIADAIIASTAICWTYINVAEYVNAENGLGQLIQNARRFSAMDQVFVGIFVIIALSLITYQGMTALKQRLYDWEIL